MQHNMEEISSQEKIENLKLSTAKSDTLSISSQPKYLLNNQCTPSLNSAEDLSLILFEQKDKKNNRRASEDFPALKKVDVGFNSDTSIVSKGMLIITEEERRKLLIWQHNDKIFGLENLRPRKSIIRRLKFIGPEITNQKGKTTQDIHATVEIDISEIKRKKSAKIEKEQRAEQKEEVRKKKPLSLEAALDCLEKIKKSQELDSLTKLMILGMVSKACVIEDDDSMSVSRTTRSMVWLLMMIFRKTETAKKNNIGKHL